MREHVDRMTVFGLTCKAAAVLCIPSSAARIDATHSVNLTVQVIATHTDSQKRTFDIGQV